MTDDPETDFGIMGNRPLAVRADHFLDIGKMVENR